MADAAAKLRTTLGKIGTPATDDAVAPSRAKKLLGIPAPNLLAGSIGYPLAT